MAKSKLPQTLERVLRGQVIDLDRPGPILRDFQTVLDFLGSGAIRTTGKYGFPPGAAVEQLDRLISRPLHLELKRTQITSYPYLQGLWLLLRVTGLHRVEGKGARARITLDPDVLAQWNALNPTERYFNLLEAWLLLGRSEMVGDKEGRLDQHLLGPCLRLWHQLPPTGERFNLNQPAFVLVPGIDQSFYQVALLDLFGLMRVEQADPPIAPWRPAAIGHLPFGDALFTVFFEQFGPYTPHVVLDEEGVADFGAWQPLFQPFFPEWRNNLVLEEPAPREGTFVFKVSLGGVWRLIAVRDSDTLDTLVGWILKSVGFDNDHLYQFTLQDRFGVRVRVTHPYMDDGIPADDFLIGELPLEPGQSMALLYDFGDSWRFDVRLERIEPPDKKIKAPAILEKHGRAPQQYPSWDE